MHTFLQFCTTIGLLLAARYTFTPLRAALRKDMGTARQIKLIVSPEPMSFEEEEAIKRAVASTLTIVLIAWGILMAWLTYFFAGLLHTTMGRGPLFVVALVATGTLVIKDTAEEATIGRSCFFGSRQTLRALPMTSKCVYVVCVVTYLLAVAVCLNAAGFFPVFGALI